MKMKDILHELESSDDEIDSYSAPDPVQTNPNDKRLKWYQKNLKKRNKNTLKVIHLI